MIFKNPILRTIILFAYIALVYYLCLMPSSSVPKNSFLDKIYFDKWVHIMMQFGVWTLLVWKFKGPGLLINNRNKIFIVSFLLVLIIGGSIEYIQSQTGREMDWKDEVANFIGALIAWRFWLKFENKWPVYQW
jgi:VanZ family protein